MPVPMEATASEYVRFLSNTLVESRGEKGPAVNTNTLEEVPNSSWYRNRHYETRMTLDELSAGAGSSGGPRPDSIWRVEEVVAVRPVGRLILTDGRGHRYELRLDAPEHPVLSTAAGIVANRAYYALGYYVPEANIVRFSPGMLEPADGSGVTRGDIWKALDNAPTIEAGIYRAVALRIPEPVVKRIGPFRFHGTRPDDGNDIFPHERRRELRGLRVAAAWLNHTGIRATRTLDVAVRHGDSTFVRHYLYNTFEALGSGLVGPKEPWMGKEYLVEFSPVLVRMGTLGLSGGDWVNTEYPDIPHVGPFGAKDFTPADWRPEHPNPAFAHSDSADAFWMARQIAHLTDREIRSMVEPAAYPSDESTDYVATMLSRRRDSIAAAYLGFGGGLDRFRVSGDALLFDNLLHRHVDPTAPSKRYVQWHRFSNRYNRVTDALGQTSTSGTHIDLPSGNAAFLRARIRTPGYGRTDVYLRRRAEGGPPYEVVGIDRRTAPQD